MILMPQIFYVTANANARYKRNELEYTFTSLKLNICITYGKYTLAGPSEKGAYGNFREDIS